MDRTRIGIGAVLAVGVLVAPGLVLAADNNRRSYSTYTPPSQPPPVRQQFNSSAQPPLKQKFNNSSGASTQSGRSSASTQTGPKPNPKIQTFRDNARDITQPRNTRQGTPQVSSRGLHNSLESKVPDPNARNPKPTRPRSTTTPGGSTPR